MKILLIQSCLESQDDTPVLPIGLCYISSALKEQGHDVRLYDPNVSDDDVSTELTGQLGESVWDVVGISLRNIDNNLMKNPICYYATLGHLLKQIHQAAPQAKLMIGGAGFSIFPDIIMKRHPLLDYGVYQEGQETVCQLMENLDQPEKVRGVYYRTGGKVVFSGKREHPDLNRMPPSLWQQVDVKKYLKYPVSIGIVSKTGCIFNCAYCTYPRLNGKHFSVRSPKRIVDEIEYLVSTYGLKEFFFVDAMFNYPVDHASDILKEIIRRKLKVKWGAYFIERYFTEEFMELAMAAGCNCFSFSPDAIHDASMKALGKMNTQKDLYRTFVMIKNRDGARGAYSFFINPPAQDFAGFCSLLIFYFKTRILNRKSFMACSFWYPRIYPHTPLHQYAVKTSGFPEKPEALLPEDSEGLAHLFWVNPANFYINIFYKFVVTPKSVLRNWIERFCKRK